MPDWILSYPGRAESCRFHLATEEGEFTEDPTDEDAACDRNFQILFATRQFRKLLVILPRDGSTPTIGIRIEPQLQK